MSQFYTIKMMYKITKKIRNSFKRCKIVKIKTAEITMLYAFLNLVMLYSIICALFYFITLPIVRNSFSAQTCCLTRINDVVLPDFLNA
jgi:hypothetical protein